MRVVCVCLVLGLLWGRSATILTENSGPKTDVKENNRSSDILTYQESNQRSTVYGEYYPEDIHNSVGHYGYGYEHHDGYQPHTYHHHEPHYDVGLKTLLIPLAGVALLGAAALFASNPVLLQLGVVSGKRRKRSLSEVGGLMSEERFEKILLLEKFISQMPKEEVAREDRRLLASYLQCSNTLCVDHLACELHSNKTNNYKSEKHIFDLVIVEILNNEFIDEELKKNIVEARRVGQSGGDCKLFPCLELQSKFKPKTTVFNN